MMSAFESSQAGSRAAVPQVGAARDAARNKVSEEEIQRMGRDELLAACGLDAGWKFQIDPQRLEEEVEALHVLEAVDAVCRAHGRLVRRESAQTQSGNQATRPRASAAETEARSLQPPPQAQSKERGNATQSTTSTQDRYLKQGRPLKDAGPPLLGTPDIESPPNAMRMDLPEGHSPCAQDKMAEFAREGERAAGAADRAGAGGRAVAVGKGIEAAVGSQRWSQDSIPDVLRVDERIQGLSSDTSHATAAEASQSTAAPPSSLLASLPTCAPSSASRLGRMLEASFRKRPGTIGVAAKADGASEPPVDRGNPRLSKAPFGNKAPPKKDSVTALVPGGTSWRFSMVRLLACSYADSARSTGALPCTRLHTPSLQRRNISLMLRRGRPQTKSRS